MNSKKLLSAIAAGVIVASSVVPASFTAAYDSELQNAYAWAKEHNITSASDINTAGMMDSMTRIAMAKMLSNFAIDVLGRTPDTSRVCNFSDVTKQLDVDYDNGVTKACQLGLMGWDDEKQTVATSFNPYRVVDRGNFGTVLSRALWGDKNNGGNPYYKYHLNALNKVSIMNNITNPSQTELRGYVMLMLQRASAMVKTDESVTGECPVLEQLMCLLKDECSAACEKVIGDNQGQEPIDPKEEKKSGKITVTNEKNEDAVVLSQGYETELDTVIISTDEEITLNSMTFERYGLSTADSIDQIWLENENGEKVTTEKSLSSSKDAVVLNIKKDYKDLAKGKHSFVVVVKTTDKSNCGTSGDQKCIASYLGSNVGFTVSSINSSAASEKINVSAKAYLYNFGDYSSDGKVEVEYKGSNRAYSYEEGKSYEVASIKMRANTAAINVDGFTLTNNGNLDLDKISDLDILVDGVSLKNVKFSNSSRDELKITFATQEIAIKKSATFVVKVKIADFDKSGETLNFVIDNASDINAKEVKNNVRTNISLPSDRKETNEKGYTYTFNGSKVTLTNSKLNKVEAAAGSSDVVIAKGTIALNGQPITINSVKIIPELTFTGSDGKQHTFEEIVESIKLLLNGDEIAEFTSKNTWGEKLNKIDIDEDGTLEVVVDLDEDPKDFFKDQTIKFANGTLDLTDAKYQDVKLGSGEKISVIGSITISDLKVTSSKNTLTNDLTKTVEFKANQGNDSKVVFDGTLTAKKSDLRLTDVIMSGAYTGAFISGDSKNSISFDVKVGNSTVATLGFDKNSIASDETHYYETESIDDIVIKQGETVKVVVEANVNAKDEVKGLQFSLSFEAKDGKNNEAEVKAEDLVKIDVVESNSITVASSTEAIKSNNVVLAEKKQAIALFNIKPANKNTSADVDSIEFVISGSTSTDKTDFELKIGDQVIDDDNYEYDGTTLTITNIDETIKGETTVKLTYKPELQTGDYVVTLSGLNNQPKTGEKFETKSVAALVNIYQIKNLKDTTKYFYKVEYANGDTVNVSDLMLDTYTGVNSTLSEESSFEIVNQSGAIMIQKVSYKVNGALVEIEKDKTKDYFDVKDADNNLTTLKIYSNN